MNTEDPNKVNEELNKAFRESIKQLTRPTVLICGYTGTGKTTLIQKICGETLVPANEISHDAPGTKAYKEYSSTLIRFWDSQGLEPSDQEKDFIKKPTNLSKVFSEMTILKNIYTLFGIAYKVLAVG